MTSLPSTTRKRAAIATVIGALFGALLVSSLFLIASHTGLIAVRRGGMNLRIFAAALEGFEVFTLAFEQFGVGLVVFAAPLWWLLHKTHRRGWLDALFLGIFLTFTAAMGEQWLFLRGVAVGVSHDDHSQSGPLTVYLLRSLALAPIGGLVGLLIARIAYGVSPARQRVR
jgi:hypothetical protein